MFGKKKLRRKYFYDQEKEIPVIKSSLCIKNGG